MRKKKANQSEMRKSKRFHDREHFKRVRDKNPELIKSSQRLNELLILISLERQAA